MSSIETSSALIVVDFQHDFIGGSLAVPGAHDTIEPIIDVSRYVDHVILTRDFHPVDHMSFSDNPLFVDKSWPPHCVQNTEGAMIHPKIERMFPTAPIFSKGTGQDVEAYSGFDGTCSGVSLLEYLDARFVSVLYVVGLATDYCVRATVLDGLDQGFDVTVVADAVRGVNQTTTAMAVAEMSDNGAVFVTSDQVF